VIRKLGAEWRGVAVVVRCDSWVWKWWFEGLVVRAYHYDSEPLPTCKNICPRSWLQLTASKQSPIDKNPTFHLVTVEILFRYRFEIGSSLQFLNKLLSNRHWSGF
jgi:hypothetical protein